MDAIKMGFFTGCLLFLLGVQANLADLNFRLLTHN